MRSRSRAASGRVARHGDGRPQPAAHVARAAVRPLHECHLLRARQRLDGAPVGRQTFAVRPCASDPALGGGAAHETVFAGGRRAHGQARLQRALQQRRRHLPEERTAHRGDAEAAVLKRQRRNGLVRQERLQDAHRRLAAGGDVRGGEDGRR